MDYSTIRVQHDAPPPLYQQIADQIIQAVQQEAVKPGERLPPIRRLADLLGVSPITVTQAYHALTQAGVAEGQIGRGTFILHSPGVTKAGPVAHSTQTAFVSGEREAV